MSERFIDWAKTTDYAPSMRAAIVVVKDEEKGIRALCACLRRSEMERVILGVQSARK